MAMKLDHELRLTRRRSWDTQDFEVNPFMMFWRPCEANLGIRKPVYDFVQGRKKHWWKVSFAQVETGFPCVKEDKTEAGEAGRGPRRSI